MILILVLAMLILVAVIKYTNNKEIIKKNCKTEIDKANAKNARKVYSTTTTTKILLYLGIASLIIVVLLNFTNIEYVLKDFLSSQLVEESEFSYYYYLIPLYIIACRQIIIEVNIGDFLYKFFNVEEPEAPTIDVKSVLFKKSKPKEGLSFEEMLKAKEEELEKLKEQEVKEEILDETFTEEEKQKEEKKEELKEEIIPEEKPLARQQEEIELPEIKKEDK